MPSGLISYGAMEAGLGWMLRLWRSPPGIPRALRRASSPIWPSVSGRSIAGGPCACRRGRRCSSCSASSIPVLLLSHIVGTRLTDELLGTSPSYARSLLFFWVVDPLAGLRQVGLLLVAWTHGCMGLHFWLRFRRWYRATRAGVCSPLALLVPVLALLGFAAGAREVAARAQARSWLRAGAGAHAGAGDAGAARRARPGAARDAGALRRGARGRPGGAGSRARLRRRRGTIRVSYPERREVVVPQGWSRARGQPLRARPARLGVRRAGPLLHVSDPCAGRGPRTWRRPAPTSGASSTESARPPMSGSPVSFAPPVTSRWCRCSRPRWRLGTPPFKWAPVKAASERSPCSSPTSAASPGWPSTGCPTTSCSSSTATSRRWAAPIADAGGLVNQFTGDGVMALFGVERGGDVGCRQALAAAGAMVARVHDLSEALGDELEAPLRHRHRHPRGADRGRRHGLRPGRLSHRGGRHRPRRRAPRGPDQGLRLRAGHLGRGGGARAASWSTT